VLIESIRFAAALAVRTDEPLTNLRLELPNYEGLKAQLKPAEPLQVPAGKQVMYKAMLCK